MRFLNLMIACLLSGYIGTATADAGYDEFVNTLGKGRFIEPSPKFAYDVTAYSNCVLENSKNVQQTPIQANRVSTACRHKATPKKCRNVSTMPPDINSQSQQEICVEKCKSDGVWSRKFGECSLD